ncbi:MAG: methyltransferase domain-containing protein, partial [Halobacteria archaeon]|nr:methyltransferase domain-containing protein [Halobacteria archaeon]
MNSRIGQVKVSLLWQSPQARHCDRRFFDRINFWRDYFPGDLGEQLNVAEVDQVVSYQAEAGELVEPYDAHQVHRIKRSQFQTRVSPGLVIMPQRGRFYPRNLVNGISSYFEGDRRPLRCLQVDDDELLIDLNHPLARYSLKLEARLLKELEAKQEHGGVSIDIPQMCTQNGPGMQARLPDTDTDFYSSDPFARSDNRADSAFYSMSRLVPHIDSTASQQIARIYERYLQPGMQVLDMMSSWQSHLPDSLGDLAVTGLGLNQQELQHNPRLTTQAIHDLNADTRLPFKDKQFDAVICSVSVEYLIKPLEIFAEVARVLKPGSSFVVTFSERWFPTKVITLWQEMHAFERMGFVLDIFDKSQAFTNLGTESVRGLPRPANDKYAAELAESDPVYAVWGT